MRNLSCDDALCRLNRLWQRMFRFRMLRDIVTGTNKLDGTVTVVNVAVVHRNKEQHLNQ